jgi:hypothetical protein
VLVSVRTLLVTLRVAIIWTVTPCSLIVNDISEQPLSWSATLNIEATGFPLRRWHLFTEPRGTTSQKTVIFIPVLPVMLAMLRKSRPLSGEMMVEIYIT